MRRTSAIVFASATLIALWALGPYLVGVFHDDGVYALLARSIASGSGFHYPNIPGEPAATHYPPLYPLLLAFFWRFMPAFPANVSMLVRLNAPLIGLCAVGWFYFATERAGWRRTSAGVFAVVSTVLMPTLALASALLSETLFLAMLWPALLLAERAASMRTARSAITAGVAIGALMLVRTHAIALLLALLLMLALDRRWRDLGITFGSAAAVQLPWIVWTSVATPRVTGPLEGSYGSYLGWFMDGLREGGSSLVAATVRANSRESGLYLSDRFAAGLPASLQILTLCIVLVAAIAGAVALAGRTRVTIAFAVLYFGIVLVWPYNPWRFVWAVWPLFVLFVLSGFRWAWTRWPRWRAAVAMAAALPAAAAFRVELRSYASRQWRAPAAQATRQITPVLRFIHDSIPATDMILAEGEQTIALYEGRRAAPPVEFTARQYVVPRAASDGAALIGEMLRAVPAQWVVLMDPGMIRAAESLAHARPGLTRTAVLPTAVVFQVTQ